MRGLKISFLIVIPLSFVFGLWWGFKLHRDREAAAGRLKPDSKLRVLTFKGLLSRDLIASFEQEHGVHVVLTEALNPEDLWKRLEDAQSKTPFDVISLFSYQLPLAKQLVRIQAVEKAKLKNRWSISPDFLDIPGELNQEDVVPVLWGVTGILYQAKFYPERAPASWTELLGQTKLQGRVGLLASTVDLARFLKLPDSTPEASVEGNETEANASAHARSLQSQNADIKRSLSQFLQGRALSLDFMSAASFFMQAEPPIAMQINHGESAFPPANAEDWRFTLPEERASFWILSFAIGNNARRSDLGHEFLDHLLERKWALNLVQSGRQASTNKQMEETELDARLKPSYLRQIPITSFVQMQNFARAMEIRQLLPVASGPARKAETATGMNH